MVIISLCLNVKLENCSSISFMMVTTGVNLILLAGCYLLIDVLQVWEGGPFRVPGLLYYLE